MENVLNLIPYIILAIIPGLFNALVAWQELEKRYRHLIFYQPLKSRYSWIWLSIYILIPAIICWLIVINACAEKPNINWKLFLTILIYGICFPSLFDTIEKLALTFVNLSIVREWVDTFVENTILKQEHLKASIFWNALEQELKKSTNLSKSINYLKNYYFDKLFCTRNNLGYEDFQNKFEKILQQNDIDLQCQKLVTTCFKGIISRQDLPKILEQFNIPQSFIDRYF